MCDIYLHLRATLIQVSIYLPSLLTCEIKIFLVVEPCLYFCVDPLTKCKKLEQLMTLNEILISQEKASELYRDTPFEHKMLKC